jgi:hypothetical protein
MFKPGFISIVLLASTAFAADPTDEQIRQLKLKLMQKTKVDFVPHIDVSPAEFKGMADPNVLEIVILDRRKDGPSRVTDDGRIIFLYHATDKEQTALIDRAFDIRARRQLQGGT